MVNGYDILTSLGLENARGRRLRKLLGIDDDVELWIDSGGYQFLSKGLRIPVEKIAKLYKEVDADYYVSLDYPPSPRDPLGVRAYKVARSVSAFSKLRSMLRHLAEEGRLVPVFHLSTGESLRLQLTAYESCASTAAVGGLIPYIMQRAGRGSRLKAVMFMVLARKLWGGRLHVLGLASAAMIPLLKAIGIDSGDTQTWRRKAAHGKVIVPGLGERHVSDKKVSFGPASFKTAEEKSLLRMFIAKSAGLIGGEEELRASFEARALFNAWVLYEVASNGHSYLGASRAFANLYRSLEELKKMPAELIEKRLDELLRLEVEEATPERRVEIEATRVPSSQAGATVMQEP